MDFATELKGYVDRVERGIALHLPPADTRPARLHAAMRYSLEAGGKRLRPVLVLAAAELFSPSAHAADPAARPAIRQPHSAADPLPAAVAIECVHTYSLIHDDLPCMDNDDLRRGRPTCHKAFDEATALLAGDALLTHAFLLLGTAYADQPALARALVAELGEAAGSRRLIGGQMEDLLAEKKANATADDLEFIHLNKTAAMIEAALVMGGLIGGAGPSELEILRKAGRNLGLAFQIIDDVLDVTADQAALGKTPGKDAKADKTTYVKLHGLDASRRIAAQHTEATLAALTTFAERAGFLRCLIQSLLLRGN